MKKALLFLSYRNWNKEFKEIVQYLTATKWQGWDSRSRFGSQTHLFPCYHFPLNKNESRVYYEKKKKSLLCFLREYWTLGTYRKLVFLYFQHPTSSCSSKKWKMFSTLVSHTLCLRKLSFTGCITHIPLLSGYQWGPATGGHRQQSDNRKIHFPHLSLSVL